MRVIVIYRDRSDYSSTVDYFLHDFEHQTGRRLETIDPDSPEGISLCETYDLVEYPSIIALNDSGIMQNMWRGLPLPTISEVSYYI